MTTINQVSFRTLKYRPDYLYKGFESIDEARVWVKNFVNWYNHGHLHSAIRFVTPGKRHEGLDREILAARRQVYELAKARNPERWNGKTETVK